MGVSVYEFSRPAVKELAHEGPFANYLLQGAGSYLAKGSGTGFLSDRPMAGNSLAPWVPTPRIDVHLESVAT